MVQNRDSYNIVHPKDKDGVEDKQMATITLGKKLGHTNIGKAQELIAALAVIDGIDSLQPVGVYTFQVIIANTFSFDEVLGEIKAVLDRAMSAVIIPMPKHVSIET